MRSRNALIFFKSLREIFPDEIIPDSLRVTEPYNTKCRLIHLENIINTHRMDL